MSSRVQYTYNMLVCVALLCTRVYARVSRLYRSYIIHKDNRFNSNNNDNSDRDASDLEYIDIMGRDWIIGNAGFISPRVPLCPR